MNEIIPIGATAFRALPCRRGIRSTARWRKASAQVEAYNLLS
jgi:hypothetical protein